MNRKNFALTFVLGWTTAWWSGCAMSKVSLDDIQRPVRAPEMSAFDVFLGSWNWEAEVVGGANAGSKWNGTAKWEWALDQRSLHGNIHSKSDNAEFESVGLWCWHCKKNKYVWAMFNNWGYPQMGTAKYDADHKCWTMKYHSVGLDGSRSYGQYRITVVDNNTLQWNMAEWALPFHLFKKIEMTGTYRRAK